MSFKFRVRAAGIVINAKKEILLIKQKSHITSEEWWTPPGGGIEGSESSVETVQREMREECSLECRPDRLVYVREFITHKDVHRVRHVELYFTAETDTHDITLGHDPEAPEQYLIECRFWNRDEIVGKDINVYPEILKDRFWADLDSGFKGHQVYLLPPDGIFHSAEREE